MAGDSRRCTASQFFMDEETATESTYDRVVELINQASLMQKDAQKITNLKQVQELITKKEPALLDNFLDEMLAFQHDRSVEIRKFVIGFIEEACKTEIEILPKVIANVGMMLSDENVAVQKKGIQTATQLYKIALKWVCTSKLITDVMEQTWQYIVELKDRIKLMLESENDGIRTHVVKYLEMLVIVHSCRTQDSEVTKKADSEITLDQIPRNHKFVKYRRLEEEGQQTFQLLMAFNALPTISSMNLMACMGTLTSIAKQRTEFMSRAVQALESLQVNLPPTLAKSQVSSVRKTLKFQLLNLLKHPSSIDYHPQITTLLTDLGATASEVLRNLPKPDELKRKAAKYEEANIISKRLKIENVEEEKDGDEVENKVMGKITKTMANTAIDITSEDLVPMLSPTNVADLVLLSMVVLPDVMPPLFQSSYTPIAAAGTEAQIKHLARLMATQMTNVGLGIGVEMMKLKELEEQYEKSLIPEDDGGTSPKHSIQTVVGGTTAETAKKKTSPVLLVPTAGQNKGSKRMKHFRLIEITKPLEQEQLLSLTVSAIKRILDAEKSSTQGGAAPARTKILAGLVTQFGGELHDILQDFIFEDVRSRADLAFAWLYQEYTYYQGFTMSDLMFQKPDIDKYDKCLTQLLRGLQERQDQKDGLFSRLLLEAPCITDNAIEVLRDFCVDDQKAAYGVSILKDLILKRPGKQKEFLNVLLELTCHEKAEVRLQSVRTVKKLYERNELRSTINSYAFIVLKYLLLPSPPSDLFGDKKGRPEVAVEWREDVIKLCLYLYLALMPVNHTFIHELANVYVVINANIKRTILRALEVPVKGMGMNSPELLLLVENCPKGAETLITRIVHILTDKVPPSQELVARVRDLYHKRVPDVRLLIPVLNGLTKKEVIAALPKLIKLTNPALIKEGFNRLLLSHGDSSYSSPLTPAELLVALHNIDPIKSDMKTIIKATNMCFSDKVYTQEVLAVVMQQLMEQNPLPTLLMRTVIQSLSLYPRLIGFVMNILQRLIMKQVWKQKKVWEGFIKCCQRTKPQSFQVLLQLPSLQLKNVFEISPDLREPLLTHVQSLTAHQQAHIPKAIMTVLETEPILEEPEIIEDGPPGEHGPIKIKKEIIEPAKVKKEIQEKAK